MTVYHLDEIAGDVRIALDQNTTSDVLKEIGAQFCTSLSTRWRT